MKKEVVCGGERCVCMALTPPYTPRAAMGEAARGFMDIASSWAHLGGALEP